MAMRSMPRCWQVRITASSGIRQSLEYSVWLCSSTFQVTDILRDQERQERDQGRQPLNEHDRALDGQAAVQRRDNYTTEEKQGNLVTHHRIGMDQAPEQARYQKAVI